MEQIKINFHGEKAEEMRDAFFEWWHDRGAELNCESNIRQILYDSCVETEIDGNTIHVREV